MTKANVIGLGPTGGDAGVLDIDRPMAQLARRSARVTMGLYHA
jgi:hypothetical protein